MIPLRPFREDDAALAVAGTLGDGPQSVACAFVRGALVGEAVDVVDRPRLVLVVVAGLVFPQVRLDPQGSRELPRGRPAHVLEHVDRVTFGQLVRVSVVRTYLGR